MKQVTITTGKATIVVLDIDRQHEYLLATGFLIKNEETNFDENFEHVGHPSQLSEEYWKGIVNEEEESDIEDHRYAIVYPDYTDEEKAFSTATESGITLLRLNGIDDSWLNPQIFIKV